MLMYQPYESYYGGPGSSFGIGLITPPPTPLNRQTGTPLVQFNLPNFQQAATSAALVSGGTTPVGGSDLGANASEPLYGTGSATAVLGDIFRRNFQEPVNTPGVSYVPVQQGSQFSGMTMLLLLAGIAAAVYFFYVRKS
jgi:hypothetical protein